MKSVVKIGLEVTQAQAAILDSQSKIANWLYNKLLETANDLRQQYRAAPDQERRDQIGLVLYTERGLRNLIPGLIGSDGKATEIHNPYFLTENPGQAHRSAQVQEGHMQEEVAQNHAP